MDNDSILSGLLTPTKYATVEQRRRAQQHAYALMQQPDEKYTSWTQGARDVVNALVGRHIINQTTQQEGEAMRGDAASQASLLDEIQRKARSQSAPPPQATASTPAPVTTGSLSPEAAGGIAGSTQPNSENGAIAPTGNPIENPKTGYKLDEYLKRLFEVESGNNPSARKGSYRGLAQFSPDLEKKYGINDQNWTDPTTQIRAAAQHTVESGKAYQDRFGHAPTNGELYLMHQQGVNGGTSILGGEPNAPAWKTIKEAAKVSDDEAKRRIMGNIPAGSALSKKPVDQITNQQFGRLWTGKFDSEQSAYKPMMLGGPKESDVSGAGPQGQQVAQANGIPPAVAAPSASVDKDNLARFLSSSTIPQATKDKIQEMMIQGATPVTDQTAAGPRQSLPSNPNITSFPGQQQYHPITIGDIHTVQRIQTNPDGTAKTEVMMPNGKWGSFDEAMQYSRDQKTISTKQIGTAEEDTKRYADTFGGIQELADKSQEQIPKIQAMRELIKDPKFYSGTGENRYLDAAKVLSAMGIDTKGAAPNEVFRKLAAGETLNELKQFNGYGRVLATEFDQLKQSLANSSMTQPSIDKLLGMSEKLHSRAVKVGEEASNYAMKTPHFGLDKGWDIYLRNWKRKNPSLSEEDIGKMSKTSGPSGDKKPKTEKLPSGATRERIE